jgi:hypothetical protein
MLGEVNELPPSQGSKVDVKEKVGGHAPVLGHTRDQLHHLEVGDQATDIRFTPWCCSLIPAPTAPRSRTDCQKKYMVRSRWKMDNSLSKTTRILAPSYE